MNSINTYSNTGWLEFQDVHGSGLFLNVPRLATCSPIGERRGENSVNSASMSKRTHGRANQLPDGLSLDLNNDPIMIGFILRPIWGVSPLGETESC